MSLLRCPECMRSEDKKRRIIMIAAHFPASKTVKKVSVLVVVMLVMAVLVLVVSPRLTDR